MVEIGFESTSDCKPVFLLLVSLGEGDFFFFFFLMEGGNFHGSGGYNTYIPDLVFFLFLCSNQNKHIDGDLRTGLGKNS